MEQRGVLRCYCAISGLAVLCMHAGLLCELPWCVYVTGCICNSLTQQGVPAGGGWYHHGL